MISNTASACFLWIQNGRGYRTSSLKAIVDSNAVVVPIKAERSRHVRNFHTPIRIISFAVLLFGTAAAAHEREMEIRVTGEAIVMVKPDQVEIDIPSPPKVRARMRRPPITRSGSRQPLRNSSRRSGRKRT